MKKILAFAVLLFSFVALSAQSSNGGDIGPGLSGFPTYHPLVVHFPLILILVAMVMQLVLLFKSSRIYDYTVTVITVLGFLTGLLAATVFHPEPAAGISETARNIFEEHEHFAFATIALSGVASVFKIISLFTPRKWIAIVSFVMLLAASVTVTLAGHHGSELVYKEGIGPKGEKLSDSGD
jgi:uncharacterized membrane protein